MKPYDSCLQNNCQINLFLCHYYPYFSPTLIILSLICCNCFLSTLISSLCTLQSIFHIVVVHCSVAKLRLTLPNPMDCTTPGFPFLYWSLLKIMTNESVMPSNRLILYHPLLDPNKPVWRHHESQMAPKVSWGGERSSPLRSFGQGGSICPAGYTTYCQNLDSRQKLCFLF